MSSENNEVQKEVIGGERHIYVKKDERHQSGATATKQSKGERPILENRETKNIPIGQRLGQKIRENLHTPSPPIQPRKPGQTAQAMKPMLPESAEGIYGSPELNSALRVTQALAKLREEQPDLSQILMDKLQSPNTAARCKQQTAKKMNVAGERQVFRELFNVDVQTKDLAAQLEDELHDRMYQWFGGSSDGMWV